MALPLVSVVAVADNGVIGRDNGLVWRLKSDLRHFRALTIGRPIIMGRKTFLSIGKPLPGRETIVLTRDPSFQVAGVHVAHAVEDALDLGQQIGLRMNADSVCVVGGAQIYAETMGRVDRIHLTAVHASPDGDVVFPPIDRAQFRQVGREDHPAGPDDEFAFSYIDYERIRP
ncbi:diacylglycerol kinase [Alsobacter soli]|uniref:Dihydrofolate reductase n=1 Tax=Alsobacter soli TaxID=2109933 RepID=A0A2T1HUB2_9HYPH|nr:dihydrofolate reductase [Alsobacter soli]PSC05245.1 diacylglycerol kinase [Alsobacter soli]